MTWLWKWRLRRAIAASRAASSLLAEAQAHSMLAPSIQRLADDAARARDKVLRLLGLKP